MIIFGSLVVILIALLAALAAAALGVIGPTVGTAVHRIGTPVVVVIGIVFAWVAIAWMTRLVGRALLRRPRVRWLSESNAVWARHEWSRRAMGGDAESSHITDP